MRKILVPFDGSEGSMRAVRYAIAIAKEVPQAGFYLLHVVDPTRFFAFDEFIFNPNEKEKMVQEGERTLLIAKRAFDEAGVRYESEVSFGSPGSDIPAKALAHGCDAILMGTRGLSPTASFFIGSVTQRVVHNSEVPVTLVK